MKEVKVETIWAKARTRQKHHLHEAYAGQGEDARPQINSGRSWFSKRDAIRGKTYLFVIEARSTDAVQFSINAKELRKMRQDANFHNGLPMMRIAWQEFNERWDLVETATIDDMLQYIGVLETRILQLEEGNDGLDETR